MNTKTKAKADMLQAALALQAEGHHIIPLGAYGEAPPPWFVKRSGDANKALEAWPKAPRLSSWKKYQKEQPSIEQVEQWWTDCPNANIGLLTGITVNIVDCDSEQAAQWVRGNLTYTPLRVKTGKGMHFYYSATDSDAIKNSASEAVKIDIRGKGGYVVAAPSIHASGAIYTEERDAGMPCSYTDLPELTSEHIKQIKTHGKQPTAKTKPAQRFNDKVIDMGTRRPLVPNACDIDLDPDNLGPTVKEGERNDALTRVIGNWIRDGLDKSEALEQARLWNEERTVEPLPDEEVITTVNSVFRTNARNADDQDALSDDEERDEEEEEASDHWAELMPQGLDAHPPYPVEQLPDVLRNAVYEVEELTQGTIGVIASCALSVASVAVGMKFDVMRFKGKELSGPTVLWFLALVKSGGRKTSIAKKFGSELLEYQRQKNESYDLDIMNYNSKVSAIKRRAEKQLKIMEGAKESAQREEAEHVMYDCNRELLELKRARPRRTKLIYEDFTTESLTVNMHEGSRDAAIICDEGGKVLGGHSNRKETAQYNMGTLNSLWDGHGLNVERKGGSDGNSRTSILFDHGRLSVALMVQPKVMKAFLNSGGEDAREIGWAARMLLVIEKSNVGKRFLEADPLPVSTEAREAFSRSIKQVLSIVRIPAHHEHRFRLNVNTLSG